MDYISALKIIYRYECAIKRDKSCRITAKKKYGKIVCLLDADNPYVRKHIKKYAQDCIDYLAWSNTLDHMKWGYVPRYKLLFVSHTTPQIMQDIGCKDLPIVYTQHHLRKAWSPKDARTHAHGLSVELMKELPELLTVPVLIFDAPDAICSDGRTIKAPGRGIVCLLPACDRDGLPICAFFMPGSVVHQDGKKMRVTLLSSVYGRNHIETFISRAAKQNKILYVNQKQWRRMRGSLRLGESHCSPAIENLDGIIAQSTYSAQEKNRTQKICYSGEIASKRTPKRDLNCLTGRRSRNGKYRRHHNL